jgi:hypothetical protein
MRLTEQQYTDLLARRASPRPPVAPPRAVLAGVLVLGRVTTGKMNKLEQAYSQHLELQQAAGEIQWHAFEPMKLKLADGAWFTPDFGVVMRDGSFEFRETKGHWREAARVRIKVAAGLYRFFRFVAIKRVGGNWQREEFGA